MNYKNMFYGEWLRNWINVYKKPYIKSWKTIKTQVKMHIPDNVKKMKLSELNAFEIQKALNNVEHSRTRVDIYDIYHGSLKAAYKLGFIERDISDTLIKPKHVRNIGSALSPGELSAFLYLIKGHRLEHFYRFCLTTGCRRSEALNVTWGDIFPDKCLIHIKGTKTVGSDRYIPILRETALVLNEMEIGSPGVRLFPYRRDYVTKHFKKVCLEVQKKSMA